MTKRLSKADILSRAATKTKDIEVPEWPGEDGSPGLATIKAWSIRDRDEILGTIHERLKTSTINTLAPQVVAVSLVDEDGELMFGSEEGVALLWNMSHEGLVRVMNAAYHFNGLGFFATDEEGDKLREETAAKIAEGTPEEQGEESPN